MAFIPAAATVKVQLRYSALGQVLYNVLWFRDTTDSISADSMLELGTELLGRWQDHLAPLTSDDVTLSEIILTDWSSATAISVSISAIIAGEVIGNALPLNCTFTTTFKTNQRGRSGRGRVYFVGLDEGQVVGNELSLSPAQNIVNAWEAFGAAYVGAFSEWEHVVVSFQTDNAPRTDALVQTVTAYNYYDLNVDSQRRRLTGRGR